ncbi:MAG TPA: hypothetical protein VHR55_08000 [Candidatus Limnocylindria bacterium]|nr:hypothetical protein [Candidatus Limnocylindria bacterium]
MTLALPAPSHRRVRGTDPIAVSVSRSVRWADDRTLVYRPTGRRISPAQAARLIGA